MCEKRIKIIPQKARPFCIRNFHMTSIVESDLTVILEIKFVGKCLTVVSYGPFCSFLLPFSPYHNVAPSRRSFKARKGKINIVKSLYAYRLGSISYKLTRRHHNIGMGQLA